ncbi:MAG TPA: hypothetical protein VFM79_03150 [Pelobium sp.]|nr:hypothetical protein [Pelobium sp.]
MTTLTIQIEETEKEFLKKVLRKLNVKILDESDHIPNKLTQKTIDDARKGKGLAEPITNIKEFMGSI